MLKKTFLQSLLTAGVLAVAWLPQVCFAQAQGPVFSSAVLPFPENRVRGFYAKQAEKYLAADRPLPQLLPDFPGLDGGSFGHWGQNPEADNYDKTLNDIDYGGLLSQVTSHFGRRTEKAVNVQLGENGGMTALFDPQRLTFIDLWQGDLVRWKSSRFGITSGVQPAGKRILDLNHSDWSLPAGTSTRYLGLHRNGRRVVFEYKIGEARIFDHLWQQDGKPIRSISIEGKLPPGVKLLGPLAAIADGGQTKALATAGRPQWAEKAITTRGKLGKQAGPYVIDTLTIPYGKSNPFQIPMRIGGVDFLPDGRVAVSTLTGDVWLVSGVDENLDQLTWQRFAAGLNQPLGLLVKDGKILVLGRDQITRLHDTNADGEADFYQCVTNEYPTDGGNSFALTFHQDRQGDLYWFTRSKQFGMTKFKEGRRPQSIATGLRGTNGTGVSEDGKIVFSTVQEGSWTPATAIFEVGGGSYHGFFGPKKEAGPYGYQLPMCFVPRGIDNSSGDIAFLPKDRRFGPLAGKILGTSFGYCQYYMILREKIGDSSQGGVVPLPGEFLSGAHRSRFNPRDGHLYIAGTDGWQSYAKENGSLQRVRYVGGPLHLPTAIETHENGLLVRFNCRIDPDSLDVKKMFAEQWNYLYSQAYGSPEFSVRRPTRRGHDPVAIRSVHLLEDGRSIFVEIPHLHPVMQFHLYLKLTTAAGQSFTPDIYYSIFQLRRPFTDFAGYVPNARKRRYPDFPLAEKYPRDSRLVAQEALGKTTGNIVSLEVSAIAGLQYQPRRLRVPPGRRVGLTVRNIDPSMPHNLVIVQRDRLQSIGEEAMLLAADPRAIATHYAPNDPGVIALSPILNPDDQYTIYFDSPEKKGAYPFVCTFPGHWQVMQGVLYVVDPGEPLPLEPELSPTRKFVKMWKTSDFATTADNLSGRSLAHGRRMFLTAGCNKCHTIAGEGAKLGPDLTKVSERMKGLKLLQQILKPSSEINKDYLTYAILTQQGKTITGLRIKEDPQRIHLLPNPLKPEEITIVEKADIEELNISKQSTMPKGLLMTLSEEEILDLLFFVQSGGKEK